ncbi:MAG: AAA family ATPase [Deltaproteobacteria bacterium]|nr:AAA family ATPase [Deltaproteobacteria bacterium]
MFMPREPATWQDVGYDAIFAEHLVLRMLLDLSVATGRDLSRTTALPMVLVQETVENLKNAKLVEYLSTSAMGDFKSKLSDAGRARALELQRVTTYVGPAPVPWEQYLASVHAQALSHQRPSPDDLREAFSDLTVSEELLERIGPAVTSCRPMFLHGDPGNGKTSLAVRITRCFGDSVWIPHTLLIDGQLVKLFDKAVHDPVDFDARNDRLDRRWIHVRRPTVIAGGELTLQMLELQLDPHTKICEAPLQLKANCGTLVIDDFGRGELVPRDLLNRWIGPLERGIDFLRLPDGRKQEVPFECLLVFSTNLEPRELADEAFLRRIPYKIHVDDPDEQEFGDLVVKTAGTLGVTLVPHSVKYLVDRHYKMAKRPFRFCHPRDLLLQVKHLCTYEGRLPQAGPGEWDRVASNYFTLMDGT